MLVLAGCPSQKPQETNLCKLLRGQGVLGTPEDGDDYLCQRLPGTLVIGDFGPPDAQDADNIAVCVRDASREQAQARWNARGVIKSVATELPAVERRVILDVGASMSADARALAKRTGLATISSLKQIADWLPNLGVKSNAALDMTISLRFEQGARIETLSGVGEVVGELTSSCRVRMCRDGVRLTYKRLVARPTVEIKTSRAAELRAELMDQHKLGLGARFDMPPSTEKETIRLVAKQELTIASRAYEINKTLGDVCQNIQPTSWYRDKDGDGFGDPAQHTLQLSAPPGYVADRSDCDDDDKQVHRWRWALRSEGHGCACPASPAKESCTPPSSAHTRSICRGLAGQLLHTRVQRATNQEQRTMLASTRTRDAHCESRTFPHRSCKKWRGYENTITLKLPEQWTLAPKTACELRLRSGPRGWYEIVQKPELRADKRAVTAVVRVWTHPQHWELSCPVIRTVHTTTPVHVSYPLRYGVPATLSRGDAQTVEHQLIYQYRDAAGAMRAQRIFAGQSDPSVSLTLKKTTAKSWIYGVCLP